jgi:chromosome segregation ATPase
MHINTPKATNYSTYLKTTNDFNEFNEGERRNKISDILSSSFRTTYRTKSRPNFSSPLAYKDFNLNLDKSSANNDFDNITMNSTSFNSAKSKEIVTLNNILQKQNKELRQRIREMRYKINDLLNKIKIIRMDNQRLNSEKNKLLMKITNLENELDINKNLSLNQLESKSNIIAQLNEEIMNLNAIIDEKENEIINLANNINENNYDNDNGINNEYNNGKNFYDNNIGDNDIRELEDDTNTNIDIESLRQLNTNELINQIISLNNQINKLKNEKERNEQENNILNNNLVDNNDKLLKNNDIRTR